MTTDRLIVRRRPGDLETPVSAMMKLGADTPGTFLFESIPAPYFSRARALISVFGLELGFYLEVRIRIRSPQLWL